MDRSHCKKIIGNYPLFILLSDEDIANLVNLIEEVQFEANTCIVQEGKVVDSLYFIASGSASVMRSHETIEKKESIQVAVLKEGDSIGLTHEGYFSLTGFRMGTVISLTPIRLYKISIQAFKLFMDSTARHYPALKNTGEKFLLMNFIQHTFLLQHLSSAAIRHLTQKIKKIYIEQNTYIFKKYDNKFYFLTDGSIKLTYPKETSPEINLTADQFFCEEELLYFKTEEPILAYATTHCELFTFDRNDLIESLKNTSQDIFFLPLITYGILPCLIAKNSHGKYSHLQLSEQTLSKTEYKILEYCKFKKPIHEIVSLLDKNENIDKKQSLDNIFNLGKKRYISSLPPPKNALNKIMTRLFSKYKG